MQIPTNCGFIQTRDIRQAPHVGCSYVCIYTALRTCLTLNVFVWGHWSFERFKDLRATEQLFAPPLAAPCCCFFFSFDFYPDSLPDWDMWGLTRSKSLFFVIFQGRRQV